MNLTDLAYLPVAAAYLPSLLRKKRGGWAERFGRVSPAGDVPPGKIGRVLLHAVSVGEASALRDLVPMLAREAEVVVSVTTDTGLERARALYKDVATVVRYPLDLSRSVARFLDSVRPDAVGLVELEVWPNFVAACSRRGIPVGVINGRLSARSFRGYRKIRRLLAPTFGRLAFAAAQDHDYALRFQHMGVAPRAVFITGSMKWDAARPDADPARAHAAAEELASNLGIDRARPLVVAGSTAEGEEALLHASVPAGAQLLCAPRKPERFDEAAAALPGCVRRSARKGAGPLSPAGGGGGRFLLDTLGELRAAYALADVVVIGRTFAPLGGSDPIEPAALGKPVVVGPSVENFATIVDTLARGGGVVRATRDTLPGLLRDLLADGARRAAMAKAGPEVVRAEQGATARHADLLLSLLDERRPASGAVGATKPDAVA
jgi:3-deoxy-D-manno-octulosonic-acid transferase